jgi:hypothetical protein
MATKDVTVDGNLTDMSTIAATDRLLVVDDGTTALQDLKISVLSAYLAALSQTLTSKTLTSPTINTATIATPTVTALTLDGKRFSIGDAAHAAPSAGDLWYETDSGILWTYDGTRWVSANLYTAHAGMNQGASAADIIFHANNNPLSGYDIWIMTHYVQAYVITTNSGSHYWKFELRKATTSTVPARGAGTLLGSGVNSSAVAANTWFELSEAIDAAIDHTGSGLEVLFIDIYKSGSPGNAWFTQGFTYRLIHP